MWQPHLNFRLSFTIRKHRKTAPPYYPCVTGAKFKLAFSGLPSVSGMSLSPFDINSGSIFICNEQGKKLRNDFHSLISSIQGLLTKTGWSEPRLLPCTACSKCSSGRVNVCFVHAEHNEITSAPFHVHDKCDCGPSGSFPRAGWWQKLSWS